MKYVPLTVGVAAVTGLIAWGLYLTHNPVCLWGLAALPIILSWLRPSTESPKKE